MPTLQSAPAVCQAIVPCAPLSEQGASVDESSCTAVEAGGYCGLDCAAGFAGPTRTLTCPADNTDPYREPQGGASLPAPVAPPRPPEPADGRPPSPDPVLPHADSGAGGCLPLVPCAPYSGDSLDVSGCAAVPAGGSCTVSCADGFAVSSGWQTSAQLFCDAANTNPATQLQHPSSVLPDCRGGSEPSSCLHIFLAAQRTDS